MAITKTKSNGSAAPAPDLAPDDLNDFGQATAFDVLQRLERADVLSRFSPPEYLPICHWPLWSLARQLAKEGNHESARVSAAKELLDRLYGKVPVIERIETMTSIESLDLSRLTPHERQVLQSLLEKTK